MPDNKTDNHDIPVQCHFIEPAKCVDFLAVQNSSIGDLVCPLVRPLGTTNNQSLQNSTEWPERLVTFETFDQSDEETWPDQKKDNDKDKYKDKDNDKDKYI